MAWIEFPITTDVNQIKQEIYERLEEVFPGWQRDVETSAENFLIEGMANLISDLKILASDVPPEIFRQFGIQIMNINPSSAVSASAIATVVATDEDGHTLEAGTQVALTADDGEQIAFSVVYNVVIPNGNLASESGEVLLRAVTPGKFANEIGGTVEIITSTKVEWIQEFVLNSLSDGGEDEETGEEFLNKLRERMQQLSPKLITERDFEIEARNTEGVFRGLAVANYNAETEEEEEGNTISIWLATQLGQPVSAEAKLDLAESIQAKRMPNFKIFLQDAEYTKFKAKVKGRALPGFDAAVVQANVKAAVEDFFSPAKHAIDQVTNDPKSWVNRDTLRYDELVTKINNVTGFDFIEETKFSKKGSALGEANVAMTGKVPLPEPEPAEIEVTVLPAE